MRWKRRTRRSLAWPLHELRGALTAIQLGLSTGGGERSDGLQLHVERARLALDDLDCFVDGRRSRESRSREELVDMQELVLRGTRAWSQLAPCYGAELRASWRAGPAQVRGRSGRLAQALDNLIANAVEHGRGDVLVESDLVGNSIRIAVADGGQGVPSVSHIGKSSPQSRRGHGLAITKSTVREHGGRLLFEQREMGSAAVIELPVQVTPGAQRAA
jgi:signal transduction histidine kinase